MCVVTIKVIVIFIHFLFVLLLSPKSSSPPLTDVNLSKDIRPQNGQNKNRSEARKSSSLKESVKKEKRESLGLMS